MSVASLPSNNDHSVLASCGILQHSEGPMLGRRVFIVTV